MLQDWMPNICKSSLGSHWSRAPKYTASPGMPGVPTPVHTGQWLLGFALRVMEADLCFGCYYLC